VVLYELALQNTTHDELGPMMSLNQMMYASGTSSSACSEDHAEKRKLPQKKVHTRSLALMAFFH